MSAQQGLTFERLLDWIEGRLSPEEEKFTAELVAHADESVQKNVAWLRAFQQVSANTQLIAPPADLHAKFLGQFTDFMANQQPPSFLQRLVAALTFDSLLQPSAAGARATATDAPRQLVYATPLADIAISIQWRDQDQNADLFGQVLPNQMETAPEIFSIQLLQDVDELGMTMADEAGEFAFAKIAPGTYQIVVSTDDTTIELPLLTMERPAA